MYETMENEFFVGGKVSGNFLEKLKMSFERACSLSFVCVSSTNASRRFLRKFTSFFYCHVYHFIRLKYSHARLHFPRTHMNEAKT